MSEYENIVGGKLKLKGKALDVKSGGVKKKKKKKHEHVSGTSHTDEPSGVEAGVSTDHLKDINEEDQLGNEGNHPAYDDHLTPAEKKYIEQRAKLDVNLLAKTSGKSHRDRIQDFNQYLANLSEHYDIPKVGPG
ncbi:uncharacterized protein LOC116261707 isoform X1 [Nymphaea colorata]|nr:uncharacterized protein LOC116261707 isoform X1 [Nymphaea colorata]XP_031496376.1 uncharacterized protein LOC116261707 isoform X1 [Nymphaea colorata]XP_049935946.1 uncharacterized protein LOC116261707 isoform X1 [Nymphaea colorata]